MLEGLTPPVKEALCKVARQAAELSKEDYEALQSALADPRWSTNKLAPALSERGFAIGETALRKHREGTCCCAR